MEDLLIELEVYGLVVGPYQGRPLLLLKDKVGDNILPVGISEVEAQILAHGSDRTDGPHGPSLGVLKDLGVRISRANFTEMRGNRQVLEIHVSKADGVDSVIESFAENSISFCLGHKAPLFASQKFIDQCRRTPLEFALTDALNFGRDKVPPHLVQ